MAYGAPKVVEGQPRQGLPYGLFSVVSFRGSDDQHWANGIEWESMTCSPASAVVDPDCDTEFDKFFRQMSERGSAAPFVVYGSAKCGTPGGPAYQIGEESAIAHLLAREEAQAEASLWAALADEATDLNPAGALEPKAALAALEGWLGRSYGSLGVIHADREAASLLPDVEKTGARLLTTLGTPVSAGGGYPGTAPTPLDQPAPDRVEGERWLYASPALFGYRGSVFTDSALDQAKNDHYAVATRLYVVGHDPCGVAAVRMTI